MTHQGTDAAKRARALAATVVMVPVFAACGLVDGQAGSDGALPEHTASVKSAAPSPPAVPTAAPTTEVTGASAVDAEVIDHAERRYLVVTLPLDEFDIRVDWDRDVTMLEDVLEADPTVVMATNAGIFTPELVPGGLLVSDGQEMVGVNLSEGGGNFHLLPNGVFAVFDDGTATVVDSTAYEPSGVLHATQSGPALVLGGEIHPEFREGSDNLALRSGVGVSPDGRTVVVAMSWGVTNFWDFATLFRDQLGVEDALYLDGQISDVWVAGMDPPGALSGPYAGIITARAAEGADG